MGNGYTSRSFGESLFTGTIRFSEITPFIILKIKIVEED
jgi:hypothetical protein